jgi:hypothetical protein
MADYLANLSPPDVAAFYRRLAQSIDKRFGGDSLVAILLLHWLDGKGQVKVFPSRFVSGLSADDPTCGRQLVRFFFLRRMCRTAALVG